MSVERCGESSSWRLGPTQSAEWLVPVTEVLLQCERSPERVAIRGPQGELAYAQLTERIQQMAEILRSRGVKRGDKVALLLAPGPDVIVAILGILSIGAAYVPIDPAYPAARIGYIAENVGAALIIVQDETRLLAPHGMQLLSVHDRLSKQAFTGRGLDADGHDAIYVIYTSGSTGQPKGAAVRNAGFANLLQWYRRTLDLGDADRVLLVSALGFDLTQKNIFAPLLAGGSLVFPSSAVYDPIALADDIERHGVTVVNCTPSSFLPLVEGPAARRPEVLRSLRWVVLGGEPIPAHRLRPWLSSEHCSARILNSYGPTECTDICLAYAFGSDGADEPVPLGSPIDNTRLVVLDEDLRPVPAGVDGELWIAGAGVGLGYVGRPDLTQERFVRLELEGTEELSYRTGDRVRVGTDGLFHFLGRLDHQVKLSGRRIELPEIEATLRAHSDVTEAIVVVRSDQHLVAYVTAAISGCDVEALRRHAASVLPDYMVPVEINLLDRFPLSPNGKIDRGALSARPPKPVQAPGAIGADGLDRIIAEVWAQVLGEPPAGEALNFFDIGGTSLGMASVQAELVRRLGRDVPMTALFAHPTIRSLAIHLQGTERPQTASLPARASARIEAQRRLTAMRRA